MVLESASTILVSCKQTRAADNSNPRELDIEGVNITVAASAAGTTSTAASSKRKGKSAVRKDGVEILTDTTLRLKAGHRYALVGRNGSGKSTLLRAIADKLIPGIAEDTRVAVLQQIDDDNNLGSSSRGQPDPLNKAPRTVLEEVIERATAKNELEQEMAALACGIEAGGSDKQASARALRQLRLGRLQKRRFVLDKDARLRSGARGLQARKKLVALDKTVAEATARLHALHPEAAEDLPTTSDTSTNAGPIATSDPEEALAAEAQEAADLLAQLQIHAEPARQAHVEAQAKSILTGLGFSEAMWSRGPVSALSGGWRMRTALAAALLMASTATASTATAPEDENLDASTADRPADILILDEPTNFLDMLGIVWLQKYLKSLGGASGDDDTDNDNGDGHGGADDDTPGRYAGPTILLVSHDRDFLNVCTDLMLLQDHDKSLAYFHGTLPVYEAAQAERRQHQQKQKDAQDRQRAHIEATIARNFREGHRTHDDKRIKQAKMQQRKLDERWGLQKNARGGRFKLNRDYAGWHLTNRAELTVDYKAPPVCIELPDPPDLRFPGPLLSLDGVSFRYRSKAKAGGSGQTPLSLEDVSLSVHMGDRIGIVGLNGAGKSTLIRLLVDDAPNPPVRGTVTRHPRLRLAYYAQEAVDDLRALAAKSETEAEEPLTALSLLARDVAGELDEGQLRSLLGELGLPGRLSAETPLRHLSGGQLVRCALARLLWRRPQCLVLDEVTTHLDYETSMALRSALRVWPGAVVLVSHDRWFMRGAIEGMVDDIEGDTDGSGSDSADGDDLDAGTSGRKAGKGPSGRRLVYRLRLGKLAVLEGGVQEFERRLEKRVNKLLVM